MDARTQKGQRRGSALERALWVLDAIVEQPQPIGLPDIAARVELPRQTVHRILQQLEASQLIVRNPARDRFSVGPGLSRLSLAALASDNQSTPVRMILQWLVDEVQETCNIGVLKGMDLFYLERIECDWPLRIQLQAGSSVPAHCTAGGKVMLAHLPASIRRRLLETAPLEKCTDNTITDVGTLEDVFSKIRDDGYALNIEEFSIGMTAVAVPIFDGRGRVLAALAAQGPLVRISKERALALAPLLSEAANRISLAWDLPEPELETQG